VATGAVIDCRPDDAGRVRRKLGRVIAVAAELGTGDRSRGGRGMGSAVVAESGLEA